MLFGLYGIPAVFQYYINNILRKYLDIFCTVYIDDILIYSDLLSEYKSYIRKVLFIFRKAKLQINITKYEFYIEKVLYLGFIIGRYRIKIDPIKVAAVKEWLTL